jgi:hypothetical protein
MRYAVCGFALLCSAALAANDGSAVRIIAAPAITDAQFCGTIQRILAGTTLPADNTVQRAFDDFVKAKPTVRPLRAQQYVEYDDSARNSAEADRVQDQVCRPSECGVRIWRGARGRLSVPLDQPQHRAQRLVGDDGIAEILCRLATVADHARWRRCRRSGIDLCEAVRVPLRRSGWVAAPAGAGAVRRLDGLALEVHAPTDFAAPTIVV